MVNRLKSYDFEYDGLNLSDLGYMICSFDSKGLEKASSGSQITFNTTPTLNGQKHELTSVKYEECLQATFQICKNPCLYQLAEISYDEYCELMRWLNRKNFYKFKFLEDEYLDLYFEASFNISRIEINGKLVGLELNLITNRPFALQESKIININNTTENGVFVISEISDEEGYIYPKMTITVNQQGNLSIHNNFENRTMIINNCVSGEVIEIDYPVIKSSQQNHKIQNDFNWIFFRLANTFKQKDNIISISLPCTINIEYSPIKKFGL